jgi:hypothetical protein
VGGGRSAPSLAAIFAHTLIKKARTNHARRGALLLLCLMAPVQRGKAQFVEISAQVDLLSFRSGQTNAGAMAKPRTISLVCIAGTNGWRIENDSSLNGVNKWFFDGTKVYVSLQVTRPPPQERQDRRKRAGELATAPFETARSNLTINIWPSPDGHPLGDEAVNIPWLAFCSGTYLQRKGRLIPLPCERLRHTPDRYAYSDQTQTFQDLFGLPRSVDLLFSKSLYLSALEGFLQGWGSRYLEWMKRAATNLQEGTLVFHYSVTATTNFLAWTFPLRFEFFQKGRDFLQNGDVGWRGVGTLKSLREVAALKGLFDPGMQQTIVDWRFRDEATGTDANVYTWSNAFPPQTQDPVLQDKFKARVEKARRHSESAK